MKKNDEFFVSYIEGSLGEKTKKQLRRFSWISLFIIVLAGFIFSFTQKPFKNSSFELSSESKITGVYHESPYPMLRVEVAEKEFKNILLLGFGKSSVNPFLQELLEKEKTLQGKTLSIEGNLIYYNGKTLIQVTDAEKVKLINANPVLLNNNIPIGEISLSGEIIDPKCYFGVMKPGNGKIHRSCAALCISGGIPPVLATDDGNKLAPYFLICDLDGKPINIAVLPFIGKPSEIKGMVEKMEDWYLLKIDIDNIKEKNTVSKIY